MSGNSFNCFIRVAIPPQTTKWEDYWLQITEFWLVISKKLGAPGHFVLPLDLTRLESGETDTNIQNSIFIETSPESGGHKLYIASTSRIEIILLFQALTAGWNFFKTAYQARRPIDVAECDYQVSSGFMNLSKEKKRLILNQETLIVGDSKQYPLASIFSMTSKQGDPSCSTKLIINVQTPDGNQQKEFAGLNPNDMRKMYASFLMHAKALADQRRAAK
jgi:hypothetical protein